MSRNIGRYKHLTAEDIDNIAKQEQMFDSSEYYQNSMNEKEFWAINRPLKVKVKVGRHIPRQVLGRNYEDDLIKVVPNYNPSSNKLIFRENNLNYINTYAPPKHLEESFWSTETRVAATKRKLDTKTWSEIPDCYLEFFSHLFDNDYMSICYFLDWLATAIDSKSRNLTALTLISMPGAGKGVLFEQVLAPLFGEHNVGIVSGENAFVNQFNGVFSDKQVILLDEADLSKTEYMNRFKTLVNDKLEVEKKGAEKLNVKNWLNIIIASNNLNAIKIEEGDRRFSVVNTTRRMLGDFFPNVSELIKELNNPDNIAKLYKWLIQHQPERDMNRPFITAKLEEVKDAGLNVWERAALQYFNELLVKNNKKEVVISLKDLQAHLETEYKITKVPGFKRFSQLADRYKTIFKVVKLAKYNNCHGVKIFGLYDTSSFDRMEVSDEDLTKTAGNNMMSKIGVVR